MTQLWAIQTGLAKEDSTRCMVEAFQKLGLQWAAFPLRPFLHHIPDLQWDGPIVYYGSTGLISRVAKDKKLRAGAAFFYSPEKHQTTWYGPRLGEAWLNHYGWFMTARRIQALASEGDSGLYFFRPNSALKTFAGGIHSGAEFKALVGRLLANGAIDPDDGILVNRTMAIQAEFRTWIIGGEVVAVVGYKRGEHIKPWYEPDGSQLLADVTAFAKEQGAKLSELEAFVLDVAVTENGLRVVEINDVHASGFYLTDHIIEVVAELSNYVAKNWKAVR